MTFHPLSIRAWGVAAAVALLVALQGPSDTNAHHTGRPCGDGGRAVCLPLQPTTAVRTLQTTGELLWCVDARARAYPNFVAQVHQANDAAAVALGIGHRQVAYGTPATTGCQVQHNMPDSHGCNGCAAWVHYANWPVIIEYKHTLNYTDWKTTIGHEMGHVYGLHEHYDDGAFRSHRNYYGYWAHGMLRSPGSASDSATVMDFGTGVWALTAYDVNHICQLLDRGGSRFTGCGFVPPPPPPACVPAPEAPCWLDGRWRFHDGWSFLPDAGCGEWYEGSVWLYGACDEAWGGRYVARLDSWLHRGTAFFTGGKWYVVP